MKARASEALPPAPGTVPEKPPEPETSTPNQVKNMKMKSRTADTPAIFSPVLSLSTSISDPSVEACWPGIPDPNSLQGLFGGDLADPPRPRWTDCERARS